MNRENIQKFEKSLGDSSKTIVLFCLDCKRVNSFTYSLKANKVRPEKDEKDDVSVELTSEDVLDTKTMRIVSPKASHVYRNAFASSEGMIRPPIEIELQETLLDYCFICDSDSQTMYFMQLLIWYQENELMIRKTGQSPKAERLLLRNDNEKWKKLRVFQVLKEDYSNAWLSYQNQLYVGAFVYLRRAFERLIQYHLKEEGLYEKSAQLSEEEKLKAIKQDIQADIFQTVLLSWRELSTGVHGLSETECKGEFFSVWDILEAQLSYEQQQEEAAKNTQNAKKAIAKFQQAHSKKQT